MRQGRGAGSAGKDGVALVSADPAAVAGLREAGGALRGDGFMQSLFWARFKARTGWKAYVVELKATAEGPTQPDLVVLVRTLRFGLKFAYIPHGPALPLQGVDPAVYLGSIAASVAGALREKLFFVRFDLAWKKDDLACDSLAADKAGARGLKRGAAVQVPDTVILDLGKSEEELLAGMKPKWRYNIRLAEKKGVDVRRGGAESLEAFYELYKETARRDGIAIHPLSYYQELFETAAAGAEEMKTQAEDAAGRAADSCEPEPRLSVWVARHEGQALAAIITLFFGKHATYLYGASSGEKRNLMPAYALQWSAIQAAAAEGCADYDFFGIPPDEDPRHPMAGLYLFKTGFGGRIEHRIGCIDYPISSLGYGLFRAAESTRLFWFKNIKKKMRKSAAHS